MTTDKLRYFVVLFALLTPFYVFGDSEKHISYSVDASDISSANLQIPVGELDIETWGGDEIQLEIDIESKRKWWIGSRKNVDDVELGVRVSGSKIYFRIDDDNLEQHWTLRIPARLSLSVDLGVGEIDIDNFESDLDLDVGVGSVRVRVANSDYAIIHAKSGVGDAEIDGFGGNTNNTRKFISAESVYDGEGDMEMKIEVGVGDIEVRRS